MTSEYELAVIDGLKVGARAPILSNESISIGDQIDQPQRLSPACRCILQAQRLY